MINPLSAAAGAVRVFGATARGMTLDTVSAAARLAERMGGSTGLGTLPIHVVILRDESGTPLVSPDRVAAALRRADEIFRAGAATRVRCRDIVIPDDPAPTRALDPRSNRRLLIDTIIGHADAYRRAMPARPLLSVVGDPVTVVIVRTIAGRTTGCSLGMTADWVICQASLFDADNPRTYDETVLAHELGHALNLPHAKDRDNLMFPVSSPPDRVRGTTLRTWQSALVQGNRHVVPPVAGRGTPGR